MGIIYQTTPAISSSSDVDHGGTGGLTDNDHDFYVRARTNAGVNVSDAQLFIDSTDPTTVTLDPEYDSPV